VALEVVVVLLPAVVVVVDDVVPVSLLNAASTWIRGLAMKLRLSVIDLPVDFNAFRISVMVAVVFFDFSTAQAPVTCGAAIDVPFKLA
jgi:hypothetical protein